MANWSYSGDPSASLLDKVRFFIGDTDHDAQQCSDAEINSVLADHGNEPYATAIVMVEGLIAKYSRKVDKTIGDLHISYSQMAGNYKTLLSQLKSRASIELAGPCLTAMVQDDKKTNENDSSLAKPSFKLGMTDYKDPSSGPINTTGDDEE